MQIDGCTINLFTDYWTCLFNIADQQDVQSEMERDSEEMKDVFWFIPVERGHKQKMTDIQWK